MIPTVGPKEISEMLGKKPGWFIRNYRKLHDEFGFPRKLPGVGNRWSRQRVLAWIDETKLAIEIVPIDPITVARDFLEARIGGRAA